MLVESVSVPISGGRRPSQGSQSSASLDRKDKFLKLRCLAPEERILGGYE